MNLIPTEWLAGAVAALVGAVALWWRGYSAARNKATVQAKDATIKAMEARNAAVDDVGDDDARERLRRNWRRRGL